MPATNASRFGDAVALAVPLLLAVQFSVGGQLFLSEVVLLLALPFLLYDARTRGVSRISHGAIALGGLWLFGLIVTDIYRGSSFHDYSRGWANVGFFLFSFAALSLLIDGRWRRVTLFAIGLAIGGLLQFYFSPNIYAGGDPWKFGYGSSVTLAGVLLASRSTVYRRPVLAAGIVIVLGVINLKMGFRSLAGECALTAAMAILAARSSRLVRLDRPAPRTFTILASSAAVGLVVFGIYAYAAGHGVLGGAAQQKYEMQQGRFGILVGGRPEVFAETQAIRDSPIVGHGSWAQGPEYVAVLRQNLFNNGYPVLGGPPSDLIPTHSYLFGAWVDGGILGAVFWLWALALAVSVLLRLHRLADGRVVLVAFFGLLCVWATLFSPLGAEGRLITAFYLVVLLLAHRELGTASRGRTQVNPLIVPRGIRATSLLPEAIRRS